MKELLTTIILLFLFLHGLRADIYVAPGYSCGLFCADNQGNITHPYDNIFIALRESQRYDSITIQLMNYGYANHYAMLRELNTTDWTDLYNLETNASFAETGTGTLAGLKILRLKNVVIQPHYCDGSSVYCYQPTDTPVLEIKTTAVNLYIQGAVSFQNIILSGVGDSLPWNPSISDGNMNYCLYTRQICCSSLQAQPTTFGAWLCGLTTGTDYSSLSFTPSAGLFIMGSPVFGGITPSLTFNGGSIIDFIQPYRTSFIQTGVDAFSLTFAFHSVQRVFFDKGFIYNPENSITTNSSWIKFQTATFVNYNPLNLINSQTGRSEGYLFFSPSLYSGVLEIISSTFTDMTTSVRNQCWDITTKAYYNLPLNDFLQTDPRSRSDLWSQYHYDHLNKPLMSSLISIKQILGSVSITSSNFARIIGTSGSVMKIEETMSSRTWIGISGSIFDNNFAYDGFANLLIVQASTASFGRMLACPRIQIQSSQFINAYGCQGSYGNVAVLCYWSPTPPQGTTSVETYASVGVSDYYDPSDPKTSLAEFLSANDEKYSYVRVSDTLFENNLLSLSNSLAVVGGYFTLLKDNVFQRNGGPSDTILLYRMQNSSYFMTRHPGQVPVGLASQHFGQSTTVYMDHIVKLYSIRNTFTQNWGPWEGSLALASSVTIKNWIKSKDGLKFTSNIFQDYNGLPEELALVSPTTVQRDQAYTLPFITVSYDETGSKVIEGAPFNLGIDANIIMDGTNFQNNILNYNLDASAWSTLQVTELIRSVMKSQRRYRSGFFKFLIGYEAIDISTRAFSLDNGMTAGRQVGFSFTNAKIFNNTLTTDGCVFYTGSIETYILNKVEITDNQIYPSASALQQSSSTNLPLLPQSTSIQHGLFCLSSKDSLSSTQGVRLLANDLVAENNTGTLFNLYADSSARLFITNSVFMDNTCSHSSIINVFDNNRVYSFNNLYISNHNPLGNIFATTGSRFIGSGNTYLKNNGVHASLFLLNSASSTNSCDLSGKAYWNTISPTYSLFSQKFAPQGGLIFINAAPLVVSNFAFLDNYAYSGLFTSVSATVTLAGSTIKDHNITGTSVIGNFIFMSSFNLINTTLTNCSITSDTLAPVPQAAILSLFTSDLKMKNVNFQQNLVYDKAIFIFGNSIEALIENLNLKDVNRNGVGHAALFNFISSTLKIRTMTCQNITNLFSALSSSLNIQSLSIQNLVPRYSAQYLFHVSSTSLKVNTMDYNGDGDEGNLLPLIRGDDNDVEMTKVRFYNPTRAQTKVFDLKNPNTMLITNSHFEYSEPLDRTAVFDLSSNNITVIEKCTFINAAIVLQATQAKGDVFFMSNTIIPSPAVETMVFDSCGNVTMIDNSFIMPANDSTNLIQTSIRFDDSTGYTKFENNIIFSLIGLNGVVEVIAENSPYTIDFTNNVFLHNLGANGGAIYLYANKMWKTSVVPTANIQGSVFLSNKAMSFPGIEGMGGALRLHSLSETKQATILEYSHFLSNKADVIGGAIFFDYTPFEANSNSQFLDNFARRENHIGSYPVRLIQLDSENPQNITYVPTDDPIELYPDVDYNHWYDIPSGPESDKDFTFAVLDMYNQVVYNDNSSVMNFYPVQIPVEQRASLASVLIVQAEEGLYHYDNFKFSYQVGGETSIIFESSAMSTFKVVPVAGLIINPTAAIDITFRLCGLGEFVVPLPNDMTICNNCSGSFWQTTQNSTESSCSSCDDATTLCLGGNNVGPKPGFWRLNETADIVLECQIDGACVGNYLDGTETNPVLNPSGECAEGYEGHLCNNCINGWAKSNSGLCTDCSVDKMHYVIFVIILLVSIFLLAKGINETMELAEKVANGNEAKKDTAILIRILTNYFQLIAVIGTIPIVWPSFMKDTLNVNSKIGSFTEQLLAIDCFVSHTPLGKDKNLHFYKIALASLGPFALVLFGGLFWILYFLKKKKKIWSRDYVNHFVTTAVIICFNMQPMAIKSSFSMFQCSNLYRVDSPMYFLIDDYDIECWEGNHKGWIMYMGLPSLILWILILPLSMFFILWRNRDKLNTYKMTMRYCFLYLGYRREKYFWEFIIMIRKIALIFGSVLSTLYSSDLELYFSITLTIVCYVLHSWNKPFSDSKLNHIEDVSLLSSEIVILCGLYFKLIKRSDWLDIIMIVFGFLGVLYFAVVFLRHFLKVQLLALKQNSLALKVLDFVRRRCCCCMKRHRIWSILGVGAPIGFASHVRTTLALPEGLAKPLETDADELITYPNVPTEEQQNQSKHADFIFVEGDTPAIPEENDSITVQTESPMKKVHKYQASSPPILNLRILERAVTAHTEQNALISPRDALLSPRENALSPSNRIDIASPINIDHDPNLRFIDDSANITERDESMTNRESDRTPKLTRTNSNGFLKMKSNNLNKSTHL